MAYSAVVVERNDTGRVSKIPIDQHTPDASSVKIFSFNYPLAGLGSYLQHILSDLFLPAGYPASVPPDYLHYQIYNALQEFCNSLSSLLASRGALEGVGVGDASVSATHALLLTVLKDAFSRLTTILAAYYFGTSLYPETKTFRYLADVFNDTSAVLDTIVPFIGSIDLSRYSSALPSGVVLQTITLCLSGGMRSLCTLVAGGSKAALTNHFASPPGGKGDVGEVSAKDASRETVIGLSGMLLGTLLIPYINTAVLTYSTLFILVGAHLLFNYLAVRSVVLRTLNRQRACILWTSFKPPPNGTPEDVRSTLSPADVALKENLFGFPNTIHDALTGRKIGRCILGASFRTVKRQCTAAHMASSLLVFRGERYAIFITSGNRRGTDVTTTVCFKEGYRTRDQLQAWIHAIEVTRLLRSSKDVVDLEDALQSTLIAIRQELPWFIECLVRSGWEAGDESMMFGSPGHLILDVKSSEVEEDKKIR